MGVEGRLTEAGNKLRTFLAPPLAVIALGIAACSGEGAPTPDTIGSTVLVGEPSTLPANPTPQEQPTSNHNEISVYLPDYYGAPKDYETIANEIGDRISKVNWIISFAYPEADGDARLPAFTAENPDNTFDTDAIQTVVNKMRNGDESLAVGGWSDNVSHEHLMEAWNTVLTSPELSTKFAQQIAEYAHSAGIQSIDIDYEPDENMYTDDNHTNLYQLIAQVKQQSGLPVTLAVPSSDAGVAFFGPRSEDEANLISIFRIMTYDDTGPWATEPGYLASWESMRASLERWMKVIPDPSRIQVGIPTYGIQCSGIIERNGPFTDCNEQVPGTEIPGFLAIENDEAGTSMVKTDDGYISFISAPQAAQIRNNLQREYPTVGLFLWEARGSGDYVRTLLD